MARVNGNTITGVEKGYINEYASVLHILSILNYEPQSVIHESLTENEDGVYYDGEVSFFGTKALQTVLPEFDNFFGGVVSTETLEVYNASHNFWINFVFPDFDRIVSDGGDRRNKGDIVLYKGDKVVLSFSLKYGKETSLNHQGDSLTSIEKAFGHFGDITKPAFRFETQADTWRNTIFSDSERGHIVDGSDLDKARLTMLKEYETLLKSVGENVKSASTKDIISHYFDLATGGEGNLTQVTIKKNGNHKVKVFDESLKRLLTKRINSGDFRYYSVWSDSGKTLDFYITNDSYTVRLNVTAKTRSVKGDPSNRKLERNSYVYFTY